MKTLDERLVKLAVAYYYYSCNHFNGKLSYDDLVNAAPAIAEYFWANKESLGVDASEVIWNRGETMPFSQEAWKTIVKVNDEGIESILFGEEELSHHPQKDLIFSFYRILPKLIRLRGDRLSFYGPDKGLFYGICFTYRDLLYIKRQYYNLGDERTILFVMEKEVKTMCGIRGGFSVTDLGIHVVIPAYPSCVLKWNDFDLVKYYESRFYFYKEQKLIYKISKNFFFDSSDTNECVEFAADITNVARVATSLNPIELAEAGRYDEALQKAEHIIKYGKDDDSIPMLEVTLHVPENIYYLFNNQILILARGHYYKARVLHIMEENRVDDVYQKSDERQENLRIAFEEYCKAIELYGSLNDLDSRKVVAHLKLLLSDIEFCRGRFLNSRNIIIEAIEDNAIDDKNYMVEALKKIETKLQFVWDKYTIHYKYSERKFIMPIRDNEISGCVVDGITIFRFSNIPRCIKFPMGHPVANQLYIGHPFNPSLYVPIEESEELFFLDKVHELRYLLECLGAEEISITSVKGKGVGELRENDFRLSGGVGIKKFSAEAEYNTESKRQYDTSSHNQRSVTVKLDPLQKPFLPDGLIWYNEMPQWQRLVQSRLKGNLLEYSEFVSTAETKFTSSSEMTDIKASAKYLWAKAHAEVNECFEKQFKESTETQWKVDVKFRSMKDFEDQMNGAPENEEIKPVNQIGWSKEEQDYAEEVKFCIEDDGMIDDSERRLLERKRIKFGISQERAAEIENSLLRPQLTEDEQEYLEAVKEELVGGMIPDASRRLLDRLRKRMDISNERAKEIEIMALNR